MKVRSLRFRVRKVQNMMKIVFDMSERLKKFRGKRVAGN